MERIGEYLVRRLVGEGGMGKVYEAEERLSRRRVALKVLRPELGRSEQGREMFLNEMTILAHLDHPNIVRCLSCTEVDGDLVMALEYLEGQTLRDRLVERGRLPWSEAVDVVVQTAAGLDAAHGQTPPIIHRDLKPENLMVVGDQVKVMDFGIAKVLQCMGKSSTHSAGTLQYMSPEQIDAAAVDARSDIYCLGLVLYEMLAGRPPFESESPRELLNQQCTEPPPPLPDDVRAALPRGVERVLVQMLEKSPDRRPASAADVVRALDPFATAGSLAAAPSSAPTTAIATARDAAAVPAATMPTAPPAPATPRADTIALVERATAPREIAMPLALALFLAACVLAGVVTYLVRVSDSGKPTRAPAPASARLQPEPCTAAAPTRPASPPVRTSTRSAGRAGARAGCATPRRRPRSSSCGASTRTPSRWPTACCPWAATASADSPTVASTTTAYGSCAAPPARPCPHGSPSAARFPGAKQSASPPPLRAPRRRASAPPCFRVSSPAAPCACAAAASSSGPIASSTVSPAPARRRARAKPAGRRAGWRRSKATATSRTTRPIATRSA